MQAFLEILNEVVWGVPLLILMLGVGVYLSIKTDFIQLRSFPEALRSFCKSFKSDTNTQGVSAYRALCTALAATVGTGNLAGVAGALAIGGPGAVFWMWVCALFGMATKFAEASLAVRYRQKNSNNEIVGGPMYMIQNGLNKRWRFMAYGYCVFGLVASFGVGNATQVNTVIGGLETVVSSFGVCLDAHKKLAIGIIIAAIILLMLSGGAKRIGETTELLVPFVSIGYLILCAYVLFSRTEYIPVAFQKIIVGAITPKAVTGGVVGSALTTLRIGTSRGVFTNEAGMGTASIAHASASVNHPAEQGLMGIVEVFLDTVVICTMTALVILCSDIPIAYGTDTGIQLTAQAFSEVCGEWVCIPLTTALCLFAIATILGWGLYGARCAEFLFGTKAWKYFVCLQTFAAVTGAVLRAETVWLAADIVNGLMAIPNLLALVLLSPELVRLTKESARARSSGAEFMKL